MCERCVFLRLLPQVVLVCVMLGPFTFIGETSEPTLSKTPLNEEQRIIYRLFFQWYAAQYPDAANVAIRTIALDPSNHSSQNPCLNGIKLENLAELRSTIHLLDEQLAKGTKLRFVDPMRQLGKIRSTDPDHAIERGKSVDHAVKDAISAGLLSVSEIAFDEKHLHAFMSYGFYCGGLCGHGNNLLFEKSDGRWKISKTSCGGWVS